MNKILSIFFLSMLLSLFSHAEDNQAQFDQIYKKIREIQKLEVEEFRMSDSLNSLVYSLMFLSELGEFELSQDEIKQIAKSVYIQKGDLFSEVIMPWISKIDRLNFGLKDGNPLVTIYTINKKEIVYPINESLASPDGKKGLKVNNLHINNGATISLYYGHNKKQLVKLVRKENTLKHVPLTWYQLLNQISEGVRKNIRLYLNFPKRPIPVLTNMSGISVSMTPPDILKETQVTLKRGIFIPGLSDGDKRHSSAILSGKGSLISFNISIDQ